jgi:hypothetical protein
MVSSYSGTSRTECLPQIAQQRALTRRSFLRSAAATGIASRRFALVPVRAAALSREQRTIVVTFGAGARDEETFAPEGQANILHLVKELILQATFRAQVLNHGILGHYAATASLATGVYERFDDFADVAPKNASVFEYFRKGLGRPANDTWVIAPSNGFHRIGQSDGMQFAAGLGAQVILPKHRLASALDKTAASSAGLDFLLQDNYEDPLFTPPALQSSLPLSRLAEMSHLSIDGFTHRARTLSSAEELSISAMRQLMRQFAPSWLWITLHDMDIAHSGAYSLYLEGIQRSDRLCAET